MPSDREFVAHRVDQCPPGQTFQINAMTNEQVCAPPGSSPHYLADSGTWVMVPETWVLRADPVTGELCYVPAE